MWQKNHEWWLCVVVWNCIPSAKALVYRWKSIFLQTCKETYHTKCDNFLYKFVKRCFFFVTQNVAGVRSFHVYIQKLSFLSITDWFHMFRSRFTIQVWSESDRKSLELGPSFTHIFKCYLSCLFVYYRLVSHVQEWIHHPSLKWIWQKR